MDVTHRELVPGVELISVSTDKFKTGTLSVSLTAPLRRETATANALLLDVLYREAKVEAVEYGASIDVEAVCDRRTLGQVKDFIEGWVEPKEEWE